MLAFHFVQILFWLALSTWFGGVLFVAMASQVVFQTVRENDPILPTVLSVNLEGQHGTLLAGSIVADLLSMLVKVELACAGALLLALVAQWVLLDPQQNWLFHALRTALYLAGVAVVLYDWRVIGPRIRQSRRSTSTTPTTPMSPTRPRSGSTSYHKESVTLLSSCWPCCWGWSCSAPASRPRGPR